MSSCKEENSILTKIKEDSREYDLVGSEGIISYDDGADVKKILGKLVYDKSNPDPSCLINFSLITPREQKKIEFKV